MCNAGRDSEVLRVPRPSLPGPSLGNDGGGGGYCDGGGGGGDECHCDHDDGDGGGGDDDGGGEGARAVPDIWMDMRGFYNLIKDIKHYKHLDAHVYDR